MEILLGNYVIKIDEDDLFLLAEYNWSVPPSLMRPMARSGKKILYLYRLIMNAKPGEEVDHIQGDTLDCRKHMLRISTHQQNLFNRKSNIGSSSKYVGVQRVKSGKWLARIKRKGFNNNKTVNIGTYDTEEEAYQARSSYAKVLFGEFAPIKR